MSGTKIGKDEKMERKTNKKSSALPVIILLAVIIAAGVAAFFLLRGEKFLGGRKDITITEAVTTNTNGITDPELGNPDWIELCNPTDAAMDISNYALGVGNEEGGRFIFPSGTTIAGKGYLLVYFKDRGVSTTGKLVAGGDLAAAGETVTLYNTAGEVVHKVDIPELPANISYAMDSAGHFGYAKVPTPGAENSTAISKTPDGAQNVEAPKSLIVNEVLRGENGFVEVRNNSSKTIQLHDFYLSDNADKVNKWRFPQQTLEPGALAAVNLCGSAYAGSATADGEEGKLLFNANFKLNTEENTVYIAGSGGNIIDTFTFDMNMPGAVAAVRTAKGVEYTGTATKCAENSDSTFAEITWTDMDSSDVLRINEFLPKNKFDITDGDGDRSEWVELYNSGSEPVSLLGYYLSDNSAERDKWALPDITLGGGEYLIVFLSGKDRTDGEMHASFSISDTDEGIFLSNYNGMRSDSLLLPSELSENVSIGRGENGEVLYYARPTPAAANTAAGFAEPMGVGGFNPSSVYINEVCAVTTPRSGEMDWVEFYNGGDESVTLTGWHISDSKRELQKFELSFITVPAKGYAVLSCSGSISDAAPTVAPFSVSGSGDGLILTSADGTVIDYFETGATRLGVTSGRQTGGGSGDRVFFTQATKGSANPDVCYLSYAANAVFSNTELYHSEPFSLEIKTQNADGVIRYTTDGSKPTEQSTEYTGAITISSNTVIRAATFVSGMMPSDVATATYLFETPHSVPVVTLAMNQKDFDDVYAVSSPFVPVVEREGHIQYFEKDGSLGVETSAGIRVSGASTRRYPQKSLALMFRSGYGRKTVTYPFFGNDYIKTFGSLVLRNAGQDCLNTRIRDSFTSTAVLDMNIDSSAATFCAVYINGRYWGLYDLKENMNKDYLAAHYGVDEDTVNIIKRNTVELAGSNADFLRVRSYVVQRNASGANVVVPLTAERYAEFTKWVDAESIADYLIAREYFPDADMFNQKYWRTTDYKVRWRAIFYDSDFALSSERGDVLGHYFNVVGVPSADGSLSQMDLYCGLRSNEEWSDYFITRYIYVTKYYLNNDRLLPLFDSMVDTIQPEMDRQIARWGRPESRSHWENEISKLRSMLAARPQYAKQCLQYNFKLSEAQYAEYEAKADEMFNQNGGVFK